MSHNVRCFVYSPFGFTRKGPSYTCVSIVAHMSEGGVEPVLFTPRNFAPLPAHVSAHEALPFPLRKLPYRLVEGLASAQLDRDFLKAARRERGKSFAYLWPDPPLDLVHKLRDAGTILVREMINCSRMSAKRILDDAYIRLGMKPTHGISDASIEAENASLAEMDWVFAPNHEVERSLVEAGVAAHRIIPASYGWSPERLNFAAKDGGCRPFTAVFLGTVCVRKGAHLLIRAWRDSGVEGRLLLAGPMEAALFPLIEEDLHSGKIQHLGFVKDVAGLFAAADIFCFPSLEEGGPMVTYEAAGCGLPLLTSPMGAGRVADESCAFIVDPYDHDALVEALRMLAGWPDLRRQMGDAARQRAAQFTWREVGRKRGADLASRRAAARSAGAKP